YACSTLKTTAFAQATKLFQANASQLPPSSRPPKIFAKPTAAAPNTDVVTTDFFAYVDTDNTFKLQGNGSAVEMGDAVLGLVIQGSAPRHPDGPRSAMLPTPRWTPRV